MNLPTTLEGYGITDAATTSDVNNINESLDEIRDDIEEIRTDANKAIHYVGQVETVEELEAIENPKDGEMYDVKEDGMNYAWSSKDSRWDNLGAKSAGSR